MVSKEWIERALDYDLWANLQWTAALPGLPNPERCREVIDHIVQVQRIWLTRCWSEEEVPELPEPLDEAFKLMHAQWLEFIRITDLTAYISYTLRDGRSGFMLVEEIALHTVNHGTYHRGQLRGLCEMLPLEQVPETDLFLFFRENS